MTGNKEYVHYIHKFAFRCAIDRYLLDNLEYGPGPLQAQKEAHAFKFGDKTVVNFQCSIRLDIRDGECPVIICPFEII
jgi:hypothetical protein